MEHETKVAFAVFGVFCATVIVAKAIERFANALDSIDRINGKIYGIDHAVSFLHSREYARIMQEAKNKNSNLESLVVGKDA